MAWCDVRKTLRVLVLYKLFVVRGGLTGCWEMHQCDGGPISYGESALLDEKYRTSSRGWLLGWAGLGRCRRRGAWRAPGRCSKSSHVLTGNTDPVWFPNLIHQCSISHTPCLYHATEYAMFSRTVAIVDTPRRIVRLCMLARSLADGDEAGLGPIRLVLAVRLGIRWTGNDHRNDPNIP